MQNENTIIDGLLSFLVADGNGFGHTNNESINSGATEQAFRSSHIIRRIIILPYYGHNYIFFHLAHQFMS